MSALHSLAPELTRLAGNALDASDDAMAVFLRDGEELSYVTGNAAFGRLTAWLPEAARGLGLFRLLGVASASPDGARIVAAVAAGKCVRAELACHGQTGRAYWLGLNLMPAEAAHVVLHGHDITKRRVAGLQQQAVQTLLARVFQVIDAAVAIIGADGRMLMANPALHTLLGQPAGTLEGTLALDHLDPNSRKAVEEALAQQNQDAKPCGVPVRLSRGSGDTIAARLHSALMVRPDQQRFRILTVTPDASAPDGRIPDAGQPARFREFLVAGKIRLVGLEDVRVALGARWPEMAERAMQCAEHVARKRLGPSDSFSRTEDEGLMICFGGLTEDEASFRAAMIGREITQRLIGMNHDPATARVTAITAMVELSDGKLDSAALPRLLDERLGARRVEIEARARDTLRYAMRDTRCSLEVVSQRDGKQVAHYAHLPLAAERRIVAAAGALPPEELGDFDVDALRLQLAMERAAEVSIEGAGLPLLVEVSFSVFDTRGRTKRLVDACGRLPPAVREQLTLILTERQDGLPEARLRDCLGRLRPYCREIGYGSEQLELPPAGIGAAIMVVAASAVMSGGMLREEALFQFMPQLRARGARLLVRDVPSAAMARDLREMGVDLIAVPAPEPAQAA